MTHITNINYTGAYFKIELDTGESLRITPEIYNMYKISRELQVDNTLYRQLKEESTKAECREKALNHLASSSHSYNEMKLYLQKKGFPKDIITEILENLKEKGYIDDYEFALRYIKYRKKTKTVGESYIKRDLFKKGIDKEIVKRAIKETGADYTDPEEIFELVLKKIKSLENKKNKMTKLIFFLKQKGFSEEETRLVVDRLKREEYLVEKN